jgi:hypothetical protein
MSENQNPPPAANPPAVPPPAPAGDGSPVNMSLDLRQTLEQELGIIKVLDYVANETFDLAFGRNQWQTYEMQLVYPLFGRNQEGVVLDQGRERLRMLYDSSAINEKVLSTIDAAEQLCRNNGFKEPVQKRLSKVSLIMMVSFMAGYFILLSIPALKDYTSYILFPLLIGFCFLPQYLRSSLMKKWELFKTQNKELLLEQQQSNLAELRSFIQEVMNDARQRMFDNKIPLQMVRFILFSKDYQHVQVTDTQTMRGTTHYIMQFEYEPGMEPFQLPGTPTDAYEDSTSTTTGNPVGAEDTDVFVILKKAEFNDDGVLINYEVYFPPQELYGIIENMLANSDFTNVQKPADIIPTFAANKSIFCDCGESIKFTEMKYVVSKENSTKGFEFYLIIGKKDTCGKSPYVLFPSPGNKSVPESLKYLF